ncbi:oleosin G-like [Silene latifolia]|uniref:oleosin G-like n=1 Tax=Silene latifolia TaxID=37657 RepID=UPI003D77A98E
MADRTTTTTTLTTRPHRTTTGQPTTTNTLTTYLRHLHNKSPNSTQLIGILTLLISGGILLVLTGITLTAFVLGLIFFAPVIILTTPFWLPVATVLFFTVFGFLSLCGFGIAAVAAFSWVYRYYRGLHPPGSDRVDYARSRIATTAREVKDYAREYGGYLHNKVKDAAPGA